MPSGIYKRIKHWKMTEAQKLRARKMSLKLGLRPPSRKGIPSNENQKRAASQTLKRLWTNPKTRIKLLQSRGMLGKNHTEESKLKNRIAHLGKKMPLKVKLLLKKINTGRKKTRRELEILSKSNSGKNNHFWKGGISVKNRTLRANIMTTFKYRSWRTKIFIRDNFTCVLCGFKGTVQADHYPIPFSILLKRYKIKTAKAAIICKYLWKIKNGRTLCVPCHRQTDTFGNKAIRNFNGRT